MTETLLPPLRWLSTADVLEAMPDIDERLDLAQKTMVALATPGGSELPPKIAIHPRPDASFIHAMPAMLRGLIPILERACLDRGLDRGRRD